MALHSGPSLRSYRLTLAALSAEQTQRLNDLTPATGERHDDANMAAVDR